MGAFVENGGSAWESQPENYEIMGRVREALGAYRKRFVICEEPAQPARAAGDDACGSAFAFGLNYDLVASARDGARANSTPAGVIRDAKSAFDRDVVRSPRGGYVSSNTRDEPNFRRLRIRTMHDGQRVQARKGYYKSNAE
mgnify:CR=1 FL=1